MIKKLTVNGVEKLEMSEKAAVIAGNECDGPDCMTGCKLPEELWASNYKVINPA